MGQKQIIPEPPPVHRTLETGMLDEAPPALAVVLWQHVRRLRDWIDASPAERQALFHPEPPRWVREKQEEARGEHPEIAGDLEAVEAVLLTPTAVDAGQLAAALERLSRWAEAQGYTRTSIPLADLAARVDREEPRLANLAGRLARNAGDHTRAEAWLERGIGLARRRADWVEYTRGHLGAGILCMTTGRESRARRHLNTASTIAMREGHEWLAAEAQHDLFQFMTLRGNLVEAEVHARRAFAWYPKHHKRFPFFAADVAFLLVCQQHHSAAAALLRLFVRVVTTPQSILGLSLLVRALATSAGKQEFEEARAQLLDVLQMRGEYEAGARWNLAHADRAAGNWESARTNARMAVDLAHAQRDLETERFARALLADLEAGVPSPPELPRIDHKLTEWLAALTARLESWSPTRRGRLPSRSRADWAA
jgi:tetratricopeptide (TPR) repeat protein